MDELMKEVSAVLKTLPKESLFDENANKRKVYKLDEEKNKITVERKDGKFYVDGPRLRQLVKNVDFEERESLFYVQKKLKELGVNDKLKEAGVKSGDSVVLYDYELEWQD